MPVRKYKNINQSDVYAIVSALKSQLIGVSEVEG